VGLSAEDIAVGRGKAEGGREQAEDSPRIVTSRLIESSTQTRASSSAEAFCQTVGAKVTRTLGSARAVPYSSNQMLRADGWAAASRLRAVGAAVRKG
jgi:hypothetical protein